MFVSGRFGMGRLGQKSNGPRAIFVRKESPPALQLWVGQMTFAPFIRHYLLRCSGSHSPFCINHRHLYKSPPKCTALGH